MAQSWSGCCRRAGHEVTGLDTNFYEGCDFGDPARGGPLNSKRTFATSFPPTFEGFDAVIHLAALSNDPLGCLDESCTYDINHLGSVSTRASAAKAAGVSRFLFASSCSLYGAAGDALLDETAAFNPITAYGTSKVLVEAGRREAGGRAFSPTFLRNATAYGVSPRLRADIVVNNLVGIAYTTGDMLIQSDGTPWRPLVHVQDISRAFLAVLEAPRDAVHNQAFNVGSTRRTIRSATSPRSSRRSVPGCTVRYHGGRRARPAMLPRELRQDCGRTLPFPDRVDRASRRRGAVRGLRKARTDE